MLTPASFSKAGVFDYNSISGLLQKIEKTGNSSEVEDMILASVISTHLLHSQFIDKHNENFQTGKLNNLKVINEI